MFVDCNAIQNSVYMLRSHNALVEMMPWKAAFSSRVPLGRSWPLPPVECQGIPGIGDIPITSLDLEGAHVSMRGLLHTERFLS